MKLRKLLPALLTVCVFLSLCSSAIADDFETYSIDRILIQTFPGNGGNDLPYVYQDISAFYAQTTSPGVSVTGWSLIDGNGTSCTGKVENKSYTLNVSVASQVSNSLFSQNTQAYINNEPASVSISGDGLSATVSRSIQPRLVAATIWKDPGDEEHEAGHTFSYNSSASPYYTSVQWYVRSPQNQSYKVEEIGDVFGGVTYQISDHGANGSTCNLIAVPPQMDGWTVYCSFVGAAGATNSKDAKISVIGAKATPTPAPTPTPTPIPTPQPTPKPTPVAVTPVPTPEVIAVTEEWSEEWSGDAANHWHASRNPGVTDVKDLAPHEMVWTQTKEATKKEDGEETGVCSICGYSETRPILYSETENSLLDIPALAEWGIVALGAILLIAGIIVFMEYLAVKSRNKRRARMARKRKY